MFNRAAQRLPLTPQERAFLAGFWHIVLASVMSGIVAAAYAVFVYSTTHSLADYSWWPIIVLQIWNVVIAILVATRKYITAHADKTYAPTAVSISNPVQQITINPQQAPILQPAPFSSSIDTQDTQTELAALEAVK